MTETYIKIIKCAYELFATRGFDRTSLNSIAIEVGISKPSMYYYFTSKDHLLDVVFKIILDEIKLEKAYDLREVESDQIKETLIKTGQQHIRNQLEDPYYLGIMREFSSYSARKKQVENQFITIINDYRAGFEDLLHRCQEHGLIGSEVDLRTRSELLTSIMNGINMGLQLGVSLDYTAIWAQGVETCFATGQ